MVENCIYEFFKASFLELNTLNFQRAFGEVNKNEGLPNFQNASVKYDEEGIIANEATQENNESEIEEIINNNNNMNNYSTDNEIIITNQNNETIYTYKPSILNKIYMDVSYYERIKEGLRQVLFLGTGYGYTNTIYKPAGKTGTSESYLDLNNDGINDVKTITSTYAMFAPYDNPKYTVVVVSPNIGHYDGKKGNMAYINRYLSNDVTKLIYDKY